MPLRRRRPNLDEQIGLPEDTDVDDVLRRLLESDGSNTVSEDLEEDPEDG